jgi:hypothetical protein
MCSPYTRLERWGTRANGGRTHPETVIVVGAEVVVRLDALLEWGQDGSHGKGSSDDEERVLLEEKECRSSSGERCEY